MPQPQKGICAEASLHALYLLLNVNDDDDHAMRVKIAQIVDLIAHYDEEYYEAMVTGVVAIGSSYWHEVYPGLIPVELAPFPDVQCDDRSAPVAPCDLFIQIRADRADVCHALAMEIMRLLGNHVDLIEDIRGFRYLDGRDLTGFIYADDNPKGMQKLDITLVGELDPDFAGGSYLHVQRYRHNIAKWEQLSTYQQEYIMGRKKSDNSPLSDTFKSPRSHYDCTQVTDTQNQAMRLLRQSMPYGDMHVQGLFFVSCARSPKPFEHMLRSMLMNDENGEYDRFLDFTSAETGAAFFAPSLTFIKQRAN
ncbi:Dyp-type peroxidase [Paraglaciecola chathamensis]|uniref:Peroxidase n=1 Tax=Paraglaciecola chathamensis TaxID=368405 RepID=A0A8H9LVB3_9ALTE|nr:Dyp-type peroxidase [Paraglaciecola oceanifecundans]GGZ52359.1 peroxidase [Paraglaciecola oceanifecundans]